MQQNWQECQQSNIQLIYDTDKIRAIMRLKKSQELQNKSHLQSFEIIYNFVIIFFYPIAIEASTFFTHRP